jgi:hypothetical protein
MLRGVDIELRKRRLIGFYADEELCRRLEEVARKRRKSVSYVVRKILKSKIGNRRITVAVPEGGEWIVGKYLMEQFPKDLKDYKERITGEYRDVKVKIYLK